MSSRSRARRQVQQAQAEVGGLPPTGGLRVLFLGDTAGTGFGTVTRDLALGMVKRGMDVRILSMNEDAGFHIDPAWPQVTRQELVIVWPLCRPGWLASRAVDHELGQ